MREATASIDQGTSCSTDVIHPSPATSRQGSETDTTAKKPPEQLDIQDPQPEDGIVYPTGIKVWVAFVSLCTVSLLFGVDLAIVAATIPSLTNYFKSVENIGWYSSVYSLMTASFTISHGKLYSLMPTKKVYIVSISIFELGSLLCTVATTSPLFIFGRAIAGVGAAGIGSGYWLGLVRDLVTVVSPTQATKVDNSDGICRNGGNRESASYRGRFDRLGRLEGMFWN